MNLKGKAILITGGGRGIGKDIAANLVAKGARPILVGRDEAMLKSAAEALGDGCRIHHADLTQASHVDGLIEWCHDNAPDLSGVVNNAASQTEMDLVHGPVDKNMAAARREIALDLEAAMALSMGLLPRLCEQEQAFIMNITTGLVFAPKEASPVYCAAKAGLHAFTQTLRYQCQRNAPHVHVGEAILPMVDTDMTRGRGRGKMASKDAAAAIVDGVKKQRDTVWVGKARLLPILTRIAPSIPKRLLRGGGATPS